MKKNSSKKVTQTNRPTVFAFESPAAREVSLAADFNHWDAKAQPMQKGSGASWSVSVPLKPGRYEYRFVVDGKWVDDPMAKNFVPNPHGGRNAVREVAQPR